MNRLKQFATFHPHWTKLRHKLANGFAAALGIGLLGMGLKYVPSWHAPSILLAPMAASAALLYAAQHSPMAQPWALVGGHFTSALCGWLAVQWLHDPILIAACAVGMSITGMSLLRCLHPPGAATALLIALNYPIFQPLGGAWLAYVVILNVLMSLCAALLINAWILGKRYPDRHPHPTPIAHIDLQHALQQYPVAVSEEVLLELYRLAYQHALKNKKAAR